MQRMGLSLASSPKLIHKDGQKDRLFPWATKLTVQLLCGRAELVKAAQTRFQRICARPFTIPFTIKIEELLHTQPRGSGHAIGAAAMTADPKGNTRSHPPAR